jgi:CHAT domain-containing protein
MEGSYILLAGDESSWITPMEIQEHHSDEAMKARLVVLSGCQTGLGGVQRGGVIGIARAIQVSGAQRVVMSQWSVDDLATRDLMLAFVEELRQHFPAEALRRAMVRLRETRPQPVYWSPFTLFGTPR